MNNEYMLKDLLNTEKSLVLNMATTLNEASCDEIYEVYLNTFLNVSKQAKNLFTIAFNNSWYTLEDAGITKITKEIDKLDKDLKN